MLDAKGETGRELEDIVVTARYGAALVEPETELSEEDIAIYGADSIRDLVQRVKPLIDGTGREPVLLVNGKRVGSVGSIGTFPPEALNRLEILPREAAARYGYPSDRRVVNLALKKTFSSWHADTGVTLPTAGGRDSERVAVGRIAIDGSTYWNAQIQMSRDSSLLRSEREVARPSGPVDPVGYVAGLNGEEIDPHLSLLAGRPVFVAALPGSTALRQPDLADFVVTAGRRRQTDPNAFTTLLPSSHSYSLNAGLTHPLGDFSAAFSVNASKSGSSELVGLPMTAVTLRTNNLWSPFAGDVILVRSFKGNRALRNRHRSQGMGLSFSLSGPVGDWQVNLAANYSLSRADARFERRIDRERVQRLIESEGLAFNPYGVWPQDLILAERSQSDSDNLNLQLNLSKTIMILPAGAVTGNSSVTANAAGSVSTHDEAGSGAETRTEARQRRLLATQSFSIPIASRNSDSPAPVGDLSADLSASLEAGGGARPRPKFSGSLNWSPLPFLQLGGTYSYEAVVPTVQQLNGQRVETATRVYDFARAEIAEVVRISGGNPDLRKGHRRSLSLNGALRPLGDQSLTFNLGYQRLVSSGGIGSMPALTPAVEAAFPERIIRDAAGRLVALDTRPINLVRDVVEQLTTSLVLLASGSGRARGRGGGQLSVSLNHNWLLKSELQIQPDLLPLDRLRGDGGQSRHNISLQLVAGKPGLGVTLTGNWEGPAVVHAASAGDPQAEFRYLPTTRFTLGGFVEPSQLWPQLRGDSWLEDLKLSIDVDNLFNSYRHVALADGSVPAGYSRDELDPLGRTIRVSVRKRF